MAGNETARNDTERADLVKVAYSKALHIAAARFTEEALAALPVAETKTSLSLRYDGACSAALASLGVGNDDLPADAAACSRLCQQALLWLNAELDTWTAAMQHPAADTNQRVARFMRHWKADKDLEAFRDDASLAKLPELDRQNWRKLWTRVESLSPSASARLDRRDQ